MNNLRDEEETGEETFLIVDVKLRKQVNYAEYRKV
jgi:hypothetical protein